MEVVEVTDRRLREQFVLLPWEIYRGDPHWVPPLLRDARQKLEGNANPLFRSGPHALFLALDGDQPVGRICAGINEKLNSASGLNYGYLCLFESVKDFEVARTLFDRAAEFVVSRGATALRGPISPTNGDDYRGVLVYGLDQPPVLFQSYNPAYYMHLFEKYGFVKDYDYLAFRYDPRAMRDRYKAIEYAMRRNGFATEAIDMRRLEHELHEVKKVIDLAWPREWTDLLPPTEQELRDGAADLQRLAEPRLIRMARSGSRTVGFAAALPNYNEVLLRMNGRLFPTGWLAFLLGRRKIEAIRVFLMFVIPEFQEKGVPQALAYSLMAEAMKHGYRWGDASTILETNTTMCRQNVSCGGVHYKTYRVYRKEL